ncbi:TerC family protein [Deinococcus misasensis]|uniref:TerC family protein n=1 Tax=Deinococcus misasensis TaxID=392413 RepID=UPI00054CF8D1|nr:TerC family protein [Deinococcus misasensis]
MTELLALTYLGKPVWIWAMFIALVLTLLAFDLGVLSKKHKNKEISVAESLKLSAFYIAIAIAYGGFIWWYLGQDAALAYYTGFAVEKSLALDNIFVISLIFSYLAIPRQYQHRVLFWGILGVIVLRAIMIGLGAALVSNFDWVLYIFGAFLLLTGIKMLKNKDEETSIEDNKFLQWVQKRIKVTPTLHGEKFFVTQKDPRSGKMMRFATPLFLALVMVEFADIIFAVDSIPAIFAITQDPFIVYTSNIFAILGLRALYFALAAMVNRFEYLKYALALVLVFIGAKIFYNQIFGKMDPAISLTVTLGLLAGGVIFSMIKTRNDEKKALSSSGSK